MISTEHPRVPHWLRRELYRILDPGESIRRPKRPPIPPPPEVRRLYLALLIDGMTGWQACRALAREFRCHPERIRRWVRRFPRS